MKERQRIKRDVWELNLSDGTVKHLEREMEIVRPSALELVKETSDLCSELVKAVGVLVAAQVLRSTGKSPIHDSTLELIKSL